MRRRRTAWSIGLLVALAHLAHCSRTDRPVTPASPAVGSQSEYRPSVLVSSDIAGLPLTPGRQRTLASLRKVDDHPLYVMEYMTHVRRVSGLPFP